MILSIWCNLYETFIVARNMTTFVAVIKELWLLKLGWDWTSRKQGFEQDGSFFSTKTLMEYPASFWERWHEFSLSAVISFSKGGSKSSSFYSVIQEHELPLVIHFDVLLMIWISSLLASISLISDWTITIMYYTYLVMPLSSLILTGFPTSIIICKRHKFFRSFHFYVH